MSIKASRGPRQQVGLRRIKCKGQIFLESALSIIVVLFLIVFISRIFVWFNLRLVERQEAFKSTRLSPAENIDFYEITEGRKLYVFYQEEPQ